MDTIEEKWKKIYNTKYEISNYGRIKSVQYKTEKILKPNKKKNGYLEIGLMIEPNVRKWFLIHRLVMEIFYPINNSNMFEVNHKDENKENNRIDNLEWVTSKENCNYGTRNFRLSIKKECTPVECIETGIIYRSFKEASEKTNIDISSINMCCTGYRNRKTAGGYHWRYAT